MPQAVGLIGTVIGAASAYQQGQDAKALARNNAILQNEQADEALKTGVINQNNYRRQINQFIGRQRATIAANNVQNAGSPLALQEDTAAIGEADIANIRNQAALDAWGFKVGAGQSIARGKAAASAGTANAIGGLFSAAGQGYGMYKDSSLGSADRAYAKKYATQRKGYGASAPILGGTPHANGYYGGYA